MNHHVRRRNDAFIGMKAYRLEYPADFPAGSVEAAQMDGIDAVLALIEQYATGQTGNFGDARFEYHSKGIARENLREQLEDVSGISGSMAFEFPGIDLLFHIPKNLPDASFLALGHSFVEKAPQYEADFIRYGLQDRFIANLQAGIAAFEASLTPPEMAKDAQVEATARLGETVRRGMIARRILMGVMKIKYKNNPAKLRAWESASHIDKSSSKPETPKP